MNTPNNAAHEAVQAKPCPDKRRMLALQCTCDISGIAAAVTLIADKADSDGSISTAALLRCYGPRIAALNDLVASYLANDGMTASYMHREIYGSAKAFEGNAA